MQTFYDMTSKIACPDIRTIVRVSQALQSLQPEIIYIIRIHHHRCESCSE